MGETKANITLKHAATRRRLPGLCLFLLLSVAGGLSAQSMDPAYWYEQGRAAMVREEWYAAVEDFLECLRLNPAHAEATAALAECYYSLGEFDQSLAWVRKARTLARTSLDLANLEASIQIALGHTEEASKIIAEILAREPYNREAIFTAAELDISRGRAGDAVRRYRQGTIRFPNDRRLYISLALTLSSLGEWENARTYIDKALAQSPGDYQVNYYGAYLYAQAGLLREALGFAEEALRLRPDYPPAIALMASLRYRSGQYDEAARLADSLINLNRENPIPWYLKGLSFARMGRTSEAISILSQAADIDPNDEFIRAALEELLITATPVEDIRRRDLAARHFAKAADYRAQNLMEQAAFEYRRGLRLNPFAPERRGYADILRIQGYPARYLEELRFLQDQGLGGRALNDAVESYNALLSNALFRRWGVDPAAVSRPHWKLAVFSLDSQAGFFHADAGAAAAAYLKDILVHERNILPLECELRQANFSGAFRTAREAGADYFLVLSVSENERDLSLRGELFVARTGSRAAEFYAFRTGPDHLRYAGRGIVDQLNKALPFRAELIARRQNRGLIDKGRADGAAKGAVYQVLRKKGAEVKNEGVGIVFSPADVVGTLTIDDAGEEVAAGLLARQGFFDRINIGDEVFLMEKKDEPEQKPGATKEAPPASEPAQADPELRSLLRTLNMSGEG